MKLQNNLQVSVMNIKRLSFFLLIVMLLPLKMLGQSYTQDNEKTEVKFKVKNMGVPIKGEFSTSVFVVNFDQDNLENSMVSATIGIESLETGITKRDKDLKKKKYFDVSKFVDIKFQSTSFTKISDGKYTMTGELSIKGTSKTIELPIEVKQEYKSITISTNHNLNRKDYKVGGNSFVMSDNVEIDVIYVGESN